MGTGFGPSIPKATLSLSAYFLLEQLQWRLSEVSTGELPVNRDMCLQVFGLEANGSITDAQRLAADAELNDEQLEAVNRSLAQRVTFIWGPPGTGKTRTIGGLVRALVRHGERVLVTSHTNVAVDTALLRVIKAMDPKQIEDGLVVRVGALALKDPELPPVTMESVLERKSWELRRRQEELAVEKRRTQALRDKAAATIRAIEAAPKAEQRVASAGAALAKTEEKLKEAEKAILKARQSLKDLQDKLEQAQSAGFIRRVFFGLNPEAIRRQIADQEALIARLDSSFEIAKKERNAAGVALAEAESQKPKEAKALKAWVLCLPWRNLGHNLRGQRKN